MHRNLGQDCVFYPLGRGQAKTAALENIIRSHVVMVERDKTNLLEIILQH